MQLGMIGLGRMGANIVRRVVKGGHECVVYDHNPDAVKAMAGRRRRPRSPRCKSSPRS
ncbi:NAD binding domain of 6-phosphogluconate dehydrogenase family protein [Mycobacterium avium subsp. avium 2285 (R)]|nr:NAD binding domain of 6-phosphogluconate dehydrogenase family protein [Mycobacterium avium subsp. avium 2285 (R)]